MITETEEVLRRISAAKSAAEELVHMGLQLQGINLTTQRPIITVKYTRHCRKLSGSMVGRGFDGANMYLTYAVPYAWCQIQWCVPGAQIQTPRST